MRNEERMKMILHHRRLELPIYNTNASILQQTNRIPLILFFSKLSRNIYITFALVVLVYIESYKFFKYKPLSLFKSRLDLVLFGIFVCVVASIYLIFFCY